MTRTRQLRALALALALLCAIALGSCGALPPLGQDQERRQQTVDGLTVTLDTAREPQVNQALPVRITLTDADERPVEGAAVYLDLTMDMICIGGGDPIASADEPGQYAVTTVLPMAGDWEVTVVVESGGSERRAPFIIPVEEGPGA
jgi:protocatechuate 3,4-dioxygenase beta subunit